MRLNFKILSFILICILSIKISAQQNSKTTIYLIGDSTVADYTGNYDEGKDYMEVRYPIAGWGQEFQPYFVKDSLTSVPKFHQLNEIKVDDRARGGRSTRTFFQEGRWRSVYDSLQKNDWVLMQFGHNDAAENKTERYVPIEGYKEFLRLFVTQTRQKGAHPIILTPVARNYPWENGKLQNVHGEYPNAALEVATELNVPFIDLNQISMDFFSKKGKDFVSDKYFMNLPKGKFEAYPDGEEDNTHFQIEGAKVVAGLVFNELKKIINSND